MAWTMCEVTFGAFALSVKVQLKVCSHVRSIESGRGQIKDALGLSDVRRDVALLEEPVTHW